MSRYIDAEKILPYISRLFGAMPLAVLKMAETDGVDIVFCKECKHYDKFPTWSACTYWSGDPYEQASVNANDFCSYGERREP